MLRIRTTNAPAVATARLWAEVDLGAVRHNVAALRARLRRGCDLIAVVKADAYGHGAVEVARATLAAGAAALAVGDAQEGARLRAAGVDAPILIVGPSRAADVESILRHRLVASVADDELARALDARATGPVDVQVEVDTGMARHGVPAGAAADFARRLRAFPRLRLAGIYTHFAGVAAAERPALMLQLLLFRAVLQQLGAERPRAHACNTLAACLLPDAHFDAVRIGGGLYGFDPGVPGIGLRPALALKTTVAGVRHAAAGDRVGYGGTHACAAATTLALLPCGYADGLSRAHWNGAEVLLRGRRVPVVGQVSMNQTVVDVGDAGDVAIGDEVVLLGAQGSERVRAEERVAAGGSVYEVTSLLRSDLPRLTVDAGAPAPARGTAVEAE
jgi:alanine racemase